MGQLSEEKRRAQHFHATRAVAVKFTNMKPWEEPKKMYDNQYLYKLRGKQGYPPSYWESHWRNKIKEWGALVLEASIHDVTHNTDLTKDNRIAQLVTNGHFLF